MSALLIILASNTLLAALIATSAWGLSRWPRWRTLSHFLWVLALVKLITPPLAPLPLGWNLAPEQWFLAEASSPISRPVVVAKAGTSDIVIPPSNSETPAKSSVTTSRPARRSFKQVRIPCAWSTFAWTVGGIWLAGSAIVAVQLLWRAKAFQRSLDRCTSPAGELSRRAWRLARQAGLHSAPRVVLVEALLSPMLWGVGKRMQLIFPSVLLERLEEDEIDSLVLHELGHYARGDHWVRVLELICRVVLWWHPLVWIAKRQMAVVEEHCCDAWVVARQAGRQRSYAEALLATIDFLNEAPVLAPPVASGLGDARLLRCRLVEIMAGATHAEPSRFVWRLAWGGAAILLLLHPAFGAYTLPIHPTHSIPQIAQREANAAQESPLESPATTAPATSPRPAPSSASNSVKTELPRPPATLWASATSPNGQHRLDARTGRRLTLTNTRTGRQIDLSSYHIACVAFAPDSRSFYSGDEEGLLRHWDCETGLSSASWRGHNAEVTSLQVSPDGLRLASGSLDTLVRVWRIEDQFEITSLQADAIGCVRWSPEGDYLAVAIGGWSGSVRPELLLWPLSGQAEFQRQELDRPAGAIAWLRDPGSLLAAGWDGNSLVWDTSTGAIKPALVSKDEVSAAAWSPDAPLRMRFAPEEMP